MPFFSECLVWYSLAAPMSKVFAKCEDFVQRDVAGECLLVPLKRQLIDANCIYVLNETGTAVWNKIDGRRSLSDITGEMYEEFEVTSEQLEQDLVVLIQDLLSINAIQEVANPG